MITEDKDELPHLVEIDAETFENLSQGIFTDRHLSRRQMESDQRAFISQMNNEPCFTEGQMTDKDIGTERQRLKSE